MAVIDAPPGLRPIPAPQRPWRSGFNELRRIAILLIAAFVAALLALEVTGLRGRLGFVFIFVTTYLIGAVTWSGIQRGREAAKNALAESLIALAALAALLPLSSLLWTVFDKGRDAFYSGYLLRDMQFTQPDGPLNEGGALHALIGTALLVLIATTISVPLGILTGLYLTEIKGRFEGTVRFLIQSMSGVPSIVAGLFIYAIWILGPGQAYSGFAGALALTILMLPTVARTSEEVLKLIPRDLREAGLALGATQWRTVGRVVIPAARSGLITSAILGIARVSGETAPLLLTIFGTTALNLNPFEGPLAALPLYIFSLLTSGLNDAIARAWTGALVLMVLVLILFTLARLIGGRKRK